MALQSVFAQGLHFGSGNTNDPNQDKNHEREDTEEGDEDLEEGEIADDDEEEPTVEKLVKGKSDDKKEETKSNGSSTTSSATTATKTAGVDKSDSKFSSAPSITASDSKKRDPKRRARKRGSDDEHPDSRDVLRKRRRNQNDGEGDDDDMDMMEMMNVRGHSPSDRERSRFETGEYEGSDFDGSPSMPTPTRRSSRAERSDRLDRSDRIDRPERSERSERLERPERVRPGGRASPRRRARGNSRERERDRRRGDRERDRDRGGRPPPKNSNASMSKVKDESICAFYMEGKCSRGSDCPYSHAALPPRKMELCKFYLMDCCAKKEKCLYMHKDFPCKYFHTGKKCRHGAEDCKFSHNPLSETTRAILIKHIETAPREILGDFPRLTRDETIQAIDNFSPQSNGRDKRPHIPSLFDVHLGSNTSQPAKAETLVKEVAEERTGSEDSSTGRRVGFYQDTSVSDNIPTEENRSPENSRSIWFGQLRQEDKGPEHQTNRQAEESKPTSEHLLVSPDQQHRVNLSDEKKAMDYLATLPRRQRELFLRIQQQQREPALLDADPEDVEEDKPADDKWYSSDEEGEGRSLSDVLRSIKKEPESQTKASKDDSKSIAPNIDLGSLDNINVAEIAKVLSALQSKGNTQQSTTATASASSPEEPPLSETGRRDPRIRSARSRIPTQSVSSSMGDVDLRMQTRGDVDLRIGTPMTSDVDLRGGGGSLPAGLAPLGSLDEIGSADIDLRRFGLPFKPIPSHPPAREIDASYNSHPPIEYQVYIVDCEPLNYGLVRVHADWAHLDPRLQRDHLSERTSYCGSDVPSIPLGPASPDPVVPSRHYEPESTTFQSNRWAPNDPRSRDPRRAAAAAAVPAASSSPLGGAQHPAGSLADPRGKPGLLGAAPPGMLPYGNKNELSSEPTSYGLMNSSGFRQTSGGPFDRMYDGPSVTGPAVAGQQSPRTENRRDPRQRLRNAPATVISDTDARSYTPPPPNERVFR